MITFLIIALLIASAFLVMVILVQRGRGGGLAGAFGSGGGTSSAFGTKTGDVFTTLTVVAFVVFVLLSITLSFQFKYHSMPDAPKKIDTGKVTLNSIELTWTDESYTEKGYRIYRSEFGKDLTLVAELPADSSTFTDGKLEQGTVYSYVLAPWNYAGESRSASHSASTSGVSTRPVTSFPSGLGVELPATSSRPATTAATAAAASSTAPVATLPAASVPAATASAPATAPRP